MPDDTKFWDKIAEKYAAKPVDNVDAFEKKKAVTKAKLEPHHRVLEVGCGTGSLALELAPLVAQIDAVDISGEMIRIARSKAEAQSVDNVTFHQAPMHALPQFEPASFDCILAYSILHLVDDRPHVLKMLARLLRPGGVFISSTPCLGGSWVPWGAVLKVMQWVGKAPTVYTPSKAQLFEEMRAAGLSDHATPDVGAPARTAFVVSTRVIDAVAQRQQPAAG